MAFKLPPKEAAQVLLRALQERGHRRGKMLTRARISAGSLKALWMRETLAREWLDEVNEWLLSAGWLVLDAGSTYAAIKVSVVENWPRVASRHLDNELEKISAGKFDFRPLEKLLDKKTWEMPATLPASRRNKNRKA